MKKVLIIEDDRMSRENTAEMLELANYEVICAEDGEAGLKKIREEKPDIIICDVMMPKLDGYGVLDAISADESTSRIPFIFLSAKATKGAVRKGMSMGADDYLTKPFSEKDLLAAISIRLKRKEKLFPQLPINKDIYDDFLKDVSELTSLTDLYKNREPKTVKKKTDIYVEGETPHYLYFLASGKVKKYRVHPDGKEYTTDLVKPGDFFGSLGILHHELYRESARTIEECEIIQIPRQDFKDVVNQNRDVGVAFFRLLSNNFYAHERKLTSLAYDTVRKRTANALLELKCTYDESGNGAHPFSIDITRNDLASIVGTAQESVIRMLSDFKDEGLISITGRTIHLLDEEGLRGIW